jgi:hypothetical protein
MNQFERLCLATALLTVLGSSCRQDSSTPPSFDGRRAFSHLERQVAFGPRVPGSQAWSECRGFYYSFFDSLGLAVDSQVFDFVDPYSGATIPLVNVLASAAGERSDRPQLLLAAHWDCRPRCDRALDPARAEEGLAGANDGASGVAVLLELASLMTEQPPPVGVQLVLFDGEDWGRSGDLEFYMLGSREFARRGVRGKYQFAIVLDMIGDADQQIYREGYSQQFQADLNDMVFAAAAGLNLTTFHDTVRHFVQDDHFALNSAGLAAIDLIDFDYPYWHTELDTPDKCSPEALANVGKLMTHIIYNPSLWPKN